MTRIITELNQPILRFSSHEADTLNLREAVQGIQVFGSIGSGKSSGSGKYIALSYLNAGFGGIVLTGKVGERNEWEEYAKIVGRKDDMIYFGEGEKEKYQFNPLIYEMIREGKGAKRTENIAALFSTLVRMGNRINGSGGGSGSNDPFWDMALHRCIKATLDLLHLSGENMTVTNMVSLVRQAPEGKDNERIFGYYLADRELDELEKLEDEKDRMAGIENKTDISSKKGDDPFKDWRDNYTIGCLFKASQKYNDKQDKAFERYENHNEEERLAYKTYKENRRTFDVTKQYFLTDFPSMPDKTRSSVLEMFYAFANPFRSGLLAEYFSEGLSKTIMPEETFRNRKIIVLNFPVKEYLQLGIFAQMIYKRLWQQAVERRDVRRYPTPVFMWVDEAQYFINEDDMLFQTTARSARACTVMITQNISNYYATIGGSNAKERVDSLLGNLVTKIFHANNDYVTNEWAAKTIAQTYHKKESLSAGKGASVQMSKELAYQVQPQEFTELATGGEENGSKVEAIITSLGTWSSGTNYLKTHFDQNFEKKRG